MEVSMMIRKLESHTACSYTVHFGKDMRVLCVLLFFHATFSYDGEADGNASILSSTINEAEILWDRLLQRDELSIPLINPGKTASPVAPPIAAPVLCLVNATIDCATPEGLSCDDITPPNPVCAVGSEVASVTFGYSGNSCNPSGNSQGTRAFCQDFLTIDVSETFTVLCNDSEDIMTGLVVEPPTIPIGGVITITAPSGNLPNMIDCIIRDGSQSQIQHLVFDTSGEAPLQLTDEFGALTLLECSSSGTVVAVQSCLETLLYNIEISNTGEIPTDLTAATFVFDDNAMNFRTENNMVLLPGQSTSFQTRRLIDLCTGSEYCAETIIETKNINSSVCRDTEQYCIQLSALPKVPAVSPVSAPITSSTKIPVNPPFTAPVTSLTKAPIIPPLSTPVTQPVKAPVSPSITVPVSPPTKAPLFLPVTAPLKTPVPISTAPLSQTPISGPCFLELDTTCTISGNTSSAGKPCDTKTLGLEPCTDRPLQITLLYNGGDCSQSNNVQALKSTCADSNGGPPTTEGSKSFIVVTDIQGAGITYFQGVVPVGSQFVLGDGIARLGSDMFINIFTEDKSTLLQAVQYHTSCTSAPLDLKDRFGASQLVQFTNAAQGSVSCSVDFSFRVDISVPTSVSGSVNLTSLIATTNFGGDIDLTQQALGEVISSGGSVAVVLVGEVDASVRFMYEIMFAVEGTQNSGGLICKGVDRLSFEAGNRPAAPTMVTPTAPSTPKLPTSPSPIGRRSLT